MRLAHLVIAASGCCPAVVLHSSMTAQVSVIVADGVSCTMPGRARATTRDRRGRLWTLVGQHTNAKVLRLFGSGDRGASWQLITVVPADGVALEGSVAAAPDEDILGVAWYARDGAGVCSVFYQEFDLAGSAWLDKPQCLLRGKSKSDQYYATDCALAAGGAVAITFLTSGEPTVGRQWTGSCNAGLIARPQRDAKWLSVEQCNVGASGVGPQLVFDGKHAHVVFASYRPSRSLFVRTFDLSRKRWLQQKGIKIAEQVIGTFGFVSDRAGRLYCTYSKGENHSPTGKLLVASAPIDSLESWTIAELVADPVRTRNDPGYSSFALATGPGDFVVAIFSLASEQYRTIYEQNFEHGIAIGPRRATLSEGGPLPFTRINGLRDVHSISGLPVGVVCGARPAVSAIGSGVR